MFVAGFVMLGWLIFAALCRAAMTSPRRDPVGGAAWLLLRAFVRFMQRVRFEGLENLPRWRRGDPRPGPLIVVSNHTAGVDPLLIQRAFPTEIRWMMMRRMMPPRLASLWDWLDVIPVEGTGRETASVRTALRHLSDGGVLGVFPEGGIERPPGVVKPYQAGVGLLALKSGARILPVVISGAPAGERAYHSFLRRGRAVVRFLPMRDVDRATDSAAGIAAELQAQAARELKLKSPPPG